MLFAALRDKKKLPRWYEGKPVFQTITIKRYKDPKTKTKEEYRRLVIVSIGVDVVAKINDEVYVLSIVKIYNYFSFVFSVVPKKVEFLKILKMM